MRIIVKVKDIQLSVDDNDNNTLIKYDANNKQVQETLKLMCQEATKLLKERNTN